MRKIATLLMVILLWTGFGMFMQQSHALSSSMERRKLMTRMEALFVNLEIESELKPVSFEKIGMIVSDMKKTAITLKKNDATQLHASLDQLIERMDVVAESAQKKKSSRVRKDVDFLLEQCFRCHATHQPDPKVAK